MNLQNILNITRNLGLIIEYLGILIIAVAIIVTIARFFVAVQEWRELRKDFGRKLLFAFDFIIAGELILALFSVNLNEVIKLVLIVLSRVGLGFIISREAKEK